MNCAAPADDDHVFVLREHKNHSAKPHYVLGLRNRRVIKPISEDLPNSVHGRLVHEFKDSRIGLVLLRQAFEQLAIKHSPSHDFADKPSNLTAARADSREIVKYW